MGEWRGKENISLHQVKLVFCTIYNLKLGTRYVGDFLDGKFHGQGILHMESGASIEGTWEHGKMIASVSKLTFKDGLEYNETDNWEYCQEGDR